MKKYALTLILATVCACGLKAQTEFAPLGATWYYGNIESMFGDIGYTKVTSIDTTTIDNKKVKILQSEYHWSDGAISPSDTIYAHQSGDSVLFYFDGEFHLVYNFGLNVGDTFEIYNPDNKYCGGDGNMYYRMAIESINILNINEIQLKEFHITPLDLQTPRYSSYIEKIGTTNSLFGADCIVDDFMSGLFGSLRCYEDAEITHYQYSNEACDSTFEFDWEAFYRWEDSMRRVDVIEKEDLEWNLFYSQSDKSIVINTYNSCEPCIIKIFDMNGRIIYSSLFEPKAQTNVALERNGIYIALIISNNERCYKKIIAY